ncbi:helix-turn-helix domain-containing protein [Microbacterium arborescens]
MAPDADEYGYAFSQAVAAELRAARARLQVSYPALVESTGIPRNTLLRYLNGQRDIPMPAFGRIARALSLNPTQVLDAIQLELGE